MLKSIKLMLLLLVSGILICTSCTKEGAVGPQGAQGTAGTNGTNGNANVTSISKTVTTWTVDGTKWYTDIPNPAITQSILNYGAVMVYKVVASGGYTQLPLTTWTAGTGTNAYSTSLESVHSLGNVRVIVSDSDGTLPGSPAAGQLFKVVVIAASTRAANPDLNWADYTAVKDRFNLDK